MKKVLRDQIRAVEPLLAEFDATFRLETGGRHTKLVLQRNGLERKLTLAGSPSENRCLANHIAATRRLLQGMSNHAS